MHRRSISIGLGLIIAIAGAVAAPAAGADQTPVGTVSVAHACYVNTAKAAAQITVSGGGWAAGSTVQISDKLGRITATAAVDSGGGFRVNVTAPVTNTYAQAEVSDTIVASYQTDPSQPDGVTGPTAQSAAFQTTNYAVLQSGNKTDPHRKTTFHLSGFTPGRTVYAHYLSARGKLLTTVAFGRPTGACGLRQVTTYEYPGGHPAKGTYTIQFDDSEHYTKRTAPQYRLSFKVFSV